MIPRRPLGVVLGGLFFWAAGGSRGIVSAGDCGAKMTKPTLGEIKQAISVVVKLLKEYPSLPREERELDRILYAYFKGRYPNASRQKGVVFSGGTRGRIDFRLGGTNPAVIELAVRSQDGGNIGVGGNKPELGKLSRVPQAQAKVRVLLLVDLNSRPVSFQSLKNGYDAYHLGRGKFERQPVSVVYASLEEVHRFPWSPYRQR